LYFKGGNTFASTPRNPARTHKQNSTFRANPKHFCTSVALENNNGQVTVAGVFIGGIEIMVPHEYYLTYITV